MYYITEWNTKIVVATVANLAAAKRQCRKMGYTEMAEWAKKYHSNHSPVAYVANADGDLIYNPRFKI